MRKVFNHDFVPYERLKQVTTDTGRHYVLPDGTELKSVTTVINEKSDKKHLDRWKKKVGEVKAEQVKKTACKRGTAVHTLAERYLLNQEDYLKGSMPSNAFTFSAIKDILNTHVDNLRGVELPLYSRSLKCAGTTDLVAEYNGKLSIIDFKTSLRPKKIEWIENYFIQSTVYSLMFYERHNIPVTQVVILIAVDGENVVQRFVANSSKYYDRVKEIFLA